MLQSVDWCWMWVSAQRVFIRVRIVDGRILAWPFM